MPWLNSFFQLPLSNPGYPLVGACFVVAVLSNISAVERLWTIGKIMRDREHAEAEDLDPDETVPSLES